MAAKTVCRFCRREGVKLFLKGERCYTPKCPVERRVNGDKVQPPGQHIMRPRKLSDFGIQLREKQKVRRIYGIRERQFEKYFEISERKSGITAENLFSLLERRLDNVVYRLGLATSRRLARQLVLHGHIRVSGKKVNIPSYLVRPGEELSIALHQEKLKEIISSRIESTIAVRQVPSWLSLDSQALSAKVIAFPQAMDLDASLRGQLVVEYYSR